MVKKQKSKKIPKETEDQKTTSNKKYNQQSLKEPNLESDDFLENNNESNNPNLTENIKENLEENETTMNIEEKEEEKKKTIREFIIHIELISKVMDNREEIKKCICHNSFYSNEKEPNLYNKLEQLEIYHEKEIIPSLQVPIYPQNNNPNFFYLSVNELIKELLKFGFPLSGSMINIFISYANDYVFFGCEPFEDNVILSSDMLGENKNIIKMKIINFVQKRMLDGYSNTLINTYFKKIMIKRNDLDVKTKIFTPSFTNLDYYDEVSDKFSEESDDDDSSSNNVLKNTENFETMKDENLKKLKNKFGKMTDSHKRERKIGYIIEKVNAWRKLYEGYKNDRGIFEKYGLEQAAEQIGVSKKSLDDYLLQIRLGRSFGFDFNENKYKKIGFLRDHVKKMQGNDSVKIESTVKTRHKKRKKKSEQVKNKTENIK